MPDRRRPPQRARRVRHRGADQDLSRPEVPWFGNPRIVITIGIIVIVSFIAVPLVSLFAGPGVVGREFQPTPNLELLTQPTFTPSPTRTPSPTPEPAAATATAQAIAATATALATPSPTATPGPSPTPTATALPTPIR